MKLLLPNIKKIRGIYCLLLLKAIERRRPIVSWEEVADAVAVAGTTPNKYQVKKYLLMLANNNPPLLKHYRAGLYTTYYQVLIYGVEDDGEIFQMGLEFAYKFKNDIILALTDEETENIVTLVELLRERINQYREATEP